MICPSCAHSNTDGVRFCGRCRLSLTGPSLTLTRTRDHLYWIFRRANAGFLSGFVAWLFIPALSRVLSQQSTALLHFFVTGLLGGAFLGTIDGMIEESTPKTARGALLGGLGGSVGGLLFGWKSPSLTSDQMSVGIFLFWALAGGCIGLVSAMWERRVKKLAAGGIAGIIGGGVGGLLGYSIYAYLIQEFDPKGWLIRRLCEGFSGGIIGVSLWFCIGVAERFVVFKRRTIEDKSHKHCDLCETKNPLSGWYCENCGAVLQQSALPQNLHLSPYTTLDRLKEMFRFLSRLASVTGVIAGVVVFAVFLPVNPLLALVAVVLVALASYSLLVLFSAAAESIQIFINK